MEMNLPRAFWRLSLAWIAAATAASALLAVRPAQAQGTFITVASTTSTEQSGLFKHLLPEFTKATGIEVFGNPMVPDSNIKIIDCRAETIRAISPGDLAANGFSAAGGGNSDAR